VENKNNNIINFLYLFSTALLVCLINYIFIYHFSFTFFERFENSIPKILRLILTELPSLFISTIWLIFFLLNIKKYEKKQKEILLIFLIPIAYSKTIIFILIYLFWFVFGFAP